MQTNKLPMGNSRTIQSHLILPPDTNHHKTVFGGKVLAYIDEIAAITSMKHASGEVVTASIDSVDFLSPAREGDVIELEGIVTSTGRTSMEVYVRVISRNLMTGEERLTTESFVTMVAVDAEGHPREIPSVFPETEVEHRLFNTGPARREHRKQKRMITHK